MREENRRDKRERRRSSCELLRCEPVLSFQRDSGILGRVVRPANFPLRPRRRIAPTWMEKKARNPRPSPTDSCRQRGRATRHSCGVIGTCLFARHDTARAKRTICWATQKATGSAAYIRLQKMFDCRQPHQQAHTRSMTRRDQKTGRRAGRHALHTPWLRAFLQERYTSAPSLGSLRRSELPFRAAPLLLVAAPVIYPCPRLSDRLLLCTNGNAGKRSDRTKQLPVTVQLDPLRAQRVSLECAARWAR